MSLNKHQTAALRLLDESGWGLPRETHRENETVQVPDSEDSFEVTKIRFTAEPVSETAKTLGAIGVLVTVTPELVEEPAFDVTAEAARRMVDFLASQGSK